MRLLLKAISSSVSLFSRAFPAEKKTHGIVFYQNIDRLKYLVDKHSKKNVFEVRKNVAEMFKQHFWGDRAGIAFVS